MKKSLLLLCGAILFTRGSYGQTFKPLNEYGKVTAYELTSDDYVRDRAAEAAVIFEKGKYFFQLNRSQGIMLVQEVTTRIKIITDAGLEYAQFEIPYYDAAYDGDNLIVEGVAYNYNVEDGKIVTTPLSKSNIFEEKVRNDVKVRKIAFSDVRKGSVIELKYRRETSNFYSMGTWRFQKKIPVLYSELIYTATPIYTYSFILKGATRFDEYDSKVSPFDTKLGPFTFREMDYKCVMRNIPAFTSEEFIANVDDYCINLSFQLSEYRMANGSINSLMSTWPEVCKTFLKNTDFGKYMSAAEKEAKKLLLQLGLDGKTDLEKAVAISDYVKANYNWDGHSYNFADKKLPAFLKDKRGNAAEINLFMAGLMKAAGLNVHPVGLSTRTNGLIYKAYPFTKFINYVIVKVDIGGKTYFVDATAPLTPFGELPPRCSNVEGLVVKADTEEWVAVRQDETGISAKDISIAIDAENVKAVFDVKQTHTDYAATRYRNICNSSDENLKDLFKDKENFRLESLESKNYPAKNEPFAIDYRWEATLEQPEPGKLFLNPLLNMAPTENPFTQAERKYHVDFVYKESYKYKVNVAVPEGYSVEFLPKAVNVDNPLITLTYNAALTGNAIEIHAEYTQKLEVYPAADYKRLKANYTKMLETLSQIIILSKN